jgi:dTDP-4-amino-4,6-dideoxygalactose transaminase
MKINLTEPTIGKEEENYILKVIRSKKLVDGFYQSKSEKILKKILRAKHVSLTQSCSDALEVASLLIDIKKDDEILLPSYNFTSAANAIRMRNGTPVFVDIDKDNLNIDLEDLKNKINKNTKAIFLIHYGGICCDMDELMKIKKKHNLLLIEDNAHGFLAKYKKKFLGSFGEISTLSFHATKNFVGGQCGAIVINDKKYINKIDVILDKGTNRKEIINFKNNFLIDYNKKKFYSWHNVGSEYRASEMASAMLYAQILKRNKIQSARKKIWNFYYNFLNNLKNKPFYLLNVNYQIQQSFHLFPIIFKDKFTADRFIQFMQLNNISATFHYVPLHNSPYGKKILKNKKNLEVTENIYNRIVRIPLHANLKKKELNLITNSIKKFFKVGI